MLAAIGLISLPKFLNSPQYDPPKLREHDDRQHGTRYGPICLLGRCHHRYLGITIVYFQYYFVLTRRSETMLVIHRHTRSVDRSS